MAGKEKTLEELARAVAVAADEVAMKDVAASSARNAETTAQNAFTQAKTRLNDLRKELDAALDKMTGQVRR